MDEHELDADPIVQLQVWLDEARGIVPQPDSMTLATADPTGRPSARIVLLRGIDDRGLAFFTNRTSRKGEELLSNPRAAVVLHWWELGRQVRAEGSIVEIDEQESAAYWSTRPRTSQLAAWASPQSHALASRADLEERFTETAQRFDGVDVPLPPFWGGYRLVPEHVEFWEHSENRLHDRVCFVRSDAGWRRERLAP